MIRGAGPLGPWPCRARPYGLPVHPDLRETDLRGHPYGIRHENRIGNRLIMNSEPESGNSGRG